MEQELNLKNGIADGLETGKIYVVWNIFINDCGTLNSRRVAAFFYEDDAEEFVSDLRLKFCNEIYTIEETTFEEIKENILPF